MLRVVVLLGLALATAAHADGRRHVALLEFDGPRAASVRGEVMRIVGATSWVSSSSALAGQTVREFAAANDLDLVVEGSVRKRQHVYEIRIRFVGATGHTITRATLVAPRAALDPRSRQRITRELARALATLPPRDDDDEPTAYLPP